MSEAGLAIDPREFRNTVGLFATGVTVVAVVHDEHVHAMTANAVTSLSLEPPLVIFCVGKQARMVDELRQAGTFSINILREEQQTLSNYFAGRWAEAAPPAFHFAHWDGGPRLEGCLAALGCAVDGWLEGGDHWIVIGRVLALHQGGEPRRPLLFYSGAYRHLDQEVSPAPDLETAASPAQIFYDPW